MYSCGFVGALLDPKVGAELDCGAIDTQAVIFELVEAKVKS